MQLPPGKLRLVELDCLYDLSENPEALEVFKQAIQLKLRGYKCEYPYGVLPIDTTDFIGIHYLLCKEEAGRLVPIMAHKSISSRRCELHNVVFPALSISAAYPALRERVTRIVSQAHDVGKPVFYGSSWTIEPEIRKHDRQLVAELRNIFIAINAFQYAEATPAELIVCGVKRFKTEKFFNTTLGFNEIREGTHRTCDFKHALVSNEEMVMMHSTGVAAAGFETAEAYRSLWDDRLLLRGDRPSYRLGRLDPERREKKAA